MLFDRFNREKAATCFPSDDESAERALRYWENHPLLDLLISSDQVWWMFTEPVGEDFDSLDWRVLTVLKPDPRSSGGSLFGKMKPVYCPARWIPREVGGLLLCSPEQGWTGRTALRFVEGDMGNASLQVPGEAVGKRYMTDLIAFSEEEAAMAWIHSNK